MTMTQPICLDGLTLDQTDTAIKCFLSLCLIAVCITVLLPGNHSEALHSDWQMIDRHQAASGKFEVMTTGGMRGEKISFWGKLKSDL